MRWVKQTLRITENRQNNQYKTGSWLQHLSRDPVFIHGFSNQPFRIPHYAFRIALDVNINALLLEAALLAADLLETQLELAHQNVEQHQHRKEQTQPHESHRVGTAHLFIDVLAEIGFARRAERLGELAHLVENRQQIGNHAYCPPRVPDRNRECHMPPW